MELDMKNLKAVLIACMLVVTTAALQGCAGSPAQTASRAADNKSKMVGLKPDMTMDQVQKLMGQPDKTEMFRGKSGEVVMTYLYMTEGSGGYTITEANYTPLIFIGDKLNGWGWNQLDTAAKRYEFVVKQR